MTINAIEQSEVTIFLIDRYYITNGNTDLYSKISFDYAILQALITATRYNSKQDLIVTDFTRHRDYVVHDHYK